MERIVGGAVVLIVVLAVAVPLITRLVNVLFVPAVVGVGLYVAVRLVHAHLNRW
jgi:uncharacterized membrane protein